MTRAFLDLLVALVYSWEDKYKLHPDDMNMFDLISNGLYDGAPPRKKEPTTEKQYELEFGEKLA